MALKEYVCSCCGNTQYVFEGEENRLKQGLCEHSFEKMPPSFLVVHSSEIFMLSQLDSVHTIDDLDKALTLEAADDREVRAQNEARRQL